MLVGEGAASAFGASKRDDKANIVSSLKARVVIEFLVGCIASTVVYFSSQ